MTANWMDWGSAIANHLWQSTLFAAAAALLTLTFRKNHARVRYAIWLAASIKFLIPFSLFIAIGNAIDFGKQSASIAQPAIAFVQDISRPFDSAADADAIPAAAGPDLPFLIRNVAYAVWICGCLAVLMIYLAKVRSIKALVRKAFPLTCGRAFEALQRLEQTMGRRPPIKLAVSGSSMEPGVFGIFSPVLILPSGMPERLSDSELEAVFAHEVAHIRRRDNLFSALHMLIEALFWFHPMVWWIGAKLIRERELACDEEVLRMGKDPQAYAEGILKVCEYYLESPPACVAGVTGADMKERIQNIMTHRVGSKLSIAKRFILATTVVVALVIPIVVGLFKAPLSQAQFRTEPKPSFEVVSVKIAENCGNTRQGVNLKIPLGPSYQLGGRYFTCSQLKWIIMDAYQLDPFMQPAGGPGWIDDALFQIEAKAAGNPGKDEMRLMVQSLLEDRFKLKMHRESRKVPVYLLTTAKGGPKLQPAKDAQGNLITSLPSAEELKKKSEEVQKAGTFSTGKLSLPGTCSILMKPSGNELTGRAVNMSRLAEVLFSLVGKRKVIDKTGITGLYDINLQWNPDPSQSGLTGFVRPTVIPMESPNETIGASIFSAIQEQLGLKLESDKSPVDIFIIDSIEKPSEN
ncbi:MAG: TIGR03435 family protein [Acidobacteria bacterium]|nr:TIGR03435 family protein [Acidobacteriota bacterium]